MNEVRHLPSDVIALFYDRHDANAFWIVCLVFSVPNFGMIFGTTSLTGICILFNVLILHRGYIKIVDFPEEKC